MALNDYVLLYRGNTKMGNLLPDCVMREVYEDRLQITMHPVESGANTSDHAYLLPRTVEMEIGWADYKQGRDRYSVQQYLELLRLQSIREPVVLSCGKRNYSNMLPESITVPNDNSHKWSVAATIRWREIRISGARTRPQINTPASQATPQTTTPPVKFPITSAVPTGTSTQGGAGGSPPDAATSILPPPAPGQFSGINAGVLP